MIHEMTPKDARETMIQLVLKTISTQPDSVLLPEDGVGNASLICEMSEGLLKYIKSGELPVIGGK